MPDSEAPFIGAGLQEAELEVSSETGAVSVEGVALQGGKARVVLNRPLDVSIPGWIPGTAHGMAADGRTVSIKVEPAAEGEAALDLALLIDRSGSMDAPAGIDGEHTLSTHEVVVRGLRAASGLLRPRDKVEAWQFDNRAEQVTPGGPALDAIANALAPSRGGTEIGNALATVLTQSPARDILLLTDGQSYALDVQELARRGRHISVVLVGAGALEANVGYLAALTGGEIFVVPRAAAGDALAQAITSLRRPPPRFRRCKVQPTHLEVLQGGMRVVVEWKDQEASAAEADARTHRRRGRRARASDTTRKGGREARRSARPGMPPDQPRSGRRSRGSAEQRAGPAPCRADEGRCVRLLSRIRR
jgi:hypothetical protein